MVIMNDLEWSMLSYYVIYLQITEKSVEALIDVRLMSQSPVLYIHYSS